MSKRKGITTGETKAAQKVNATMGQALNPMNVPQPGDPMTRLFANPDSEA